MNTAIQDSTPLAQLTRNQQIEQRRQQHAARGVGIMCDFYADRAENATLWDVEGNAYTDFAAGIAVLNTGHRHPRVTAAIRDQLERFTHTAYQIVPYESVVTLMERLHALVPIKGAKRTAFFTTGAEAVENAVKIARSYTGRPGVIAFGGAFHGRTHMGMALTGKVLPYKAGFGPFPPEIYHVPFPSEVQGISVDASLAALERLFKSDIEPGRVAAIIFEPVQGEGGFNVAPPALVTSLRRLCDQQGIVLIADEVQTGFGRTGKMFAMEHHSVEADLITMAKSLAGGMPLSAVSGRAEIMDSPNPGGLGGTYAANPLAVAAALAVLDVIGEERLLDRANRLGQRLSAALAGLQGQVGCISDIRGLGSMVAAEFADPVTGQPSAPLAAAIQREGLHRKLILLTCGTHANVIRFLYPLTIPDAQFDAALVSLREAVRAVAAAHSPLAPREKSLKP